MRILTILAVACFVPFPAAAQTPAAAAGNPTSDSLRSAWKSAERNIKESAALMGEADYGFKPVDTVRTFGEIIGHVAGVNFLYCAAARGDKPKYEEDHFEKTAKTKAQLVKALGDSLAYCDEAFAALTDASAGQMVASPFGSRQVSRVSGLIGNVSHVNEHYGNLVTYFRIKGIVPPSSRRQ